MRVVIGACGSYTEDGYGCPGEWKCLTAAAQKDGEFAKYDGEVKVVGFLNCSCPGRAFVSNLAMIKKNTDFDAVHLSNCMVGAKPECPYHDMDELVKMIEEKCGVKCIKGTHNYG